MRPTALDPKEEPGRVVFMTVSEEYDQYMKEVYVYRNRERTEGLLFRYDRTNYTVTS